MHLNEPDSRRMEKIHLHAMKQLLIWDTTYINRDNTNDTIYQEINKKLKETTDKEIKSRNKRNKKAKQLKNRDSIFTILYKDQAKKNRNNNKQQKNKYTR